MTRSEAMVSVGAFLIIFLASLQIYQEYAATEDQGTESEVGIITYRYRIAQRRSATGVIWENVNQGGPIYNNSLVRTDNLSEAIIALKDNTKIELDPNTMIVVQVNDSEAKIEIKKGAVLIKRVRATGSKKFRVKAYNKMIQINASDVRIYRKRDGSLQIMPVRGTVSISSTEGKNHLSTREKALISNEKIDINRAPLKLISPDDNFRIFTDTQKVAIKFRWEKNDEAIFEIGKSSDFKQILIKKRYKNGETDIELPEGIYYWRIVLRNPMNKIELSKVRKLRIIKKIPVRLFLPLDREEFRFSSTPALIHFAWHKNHLARYYLLEIFRNRNLTGDLKKQRIFQNRISLPLKSGTYFWRITAQGAFPGAISRSPLRTFAVLMKQVPVEIPPIETVIKSKKKSSVKSIIEKPPGKMKLLFPRHRSVIDMTKRNSIAFRWEAIPGAKYYTFSLYFGSRLLKEKIFKEHHYSFVELDKLDKGKFSWRVGAKIIQKGISYNRSANAIFFITLSDEPGKPKFKKP